MRNFTIAVFVFLFLVSSSIAFAHPPSDIIFNYDKKNSILSVGVAHSVKDPQKHFIKEISIRINGKEWIMQKFANQANQSAQAASYAQVSLKKGDAIEVLAVCNESGKLKNTFKIE
ncbi:MAG: hypothetical protein A2166_03650 [Omnitrophica WOR_2 bacterium RBG_13_41_10]|nr:MAG: hypothetical protein A2166_03650 [Omnitrophica WOR_2 bacterium RBG_13_41_10]